MDRGKVQHVEAHGADRRQAGDDVVERAVARRIGGRRAREHLVPACEAGLRAGGVQAHWRRVANQEILRVHRPHRRQRRVRQQQLDPAGFVRRFEVPQQDGQLVLLRSLGALRRCVQHAAAFLDLEHHGHAGGVLGVKVVAESAPHVPPRFDREQMRTDACGSEDRFPAVVLHQGHGFAVPSRLVGGAPEQGCGKDLVAVGDDIGGDGDGLADHAPDRVVAVRDRGGDGFDGDSRGQLGGAVQVRQVVRLPDRRRFGVGQDAHFARRQRDDSVGALVQRLRRAERGPGLRRQGEQADRQRSRRGKAGIDQHDGGAVGVARIGPIAAQ